jgi:hypothetical protein
MRGEGDAQRLVVEAGQMGRAAPSPARSLPPLAACATASCPARRNGWRREVLSTSAEIRIRSVQAAMAVSSDGASHAAIPRGAAHT